jgi:hypothetical protein
MDNLYNGFAKISIILLHCSFSQRMPQSQASTGDAADAQNTSDYWVIFEVLCS